ncbi:MAG: hypothetical protein JW730_09165 [Anaerolineales bacterium]|nr:hypothetical protein [Anaerolineales bacterium]
MEKQIDKQHDAHSPKQRTASRSMHPGNWWGTLTASLVWHVKRLGEDLMKSKKTIIAAIGCGLILGMICLGLTLSPIRLQVDGWQLEVVRLIEKTSTSTGMPTSISVPATQPVASQATGSENTPTSGTNSYIVTDETWRFSRAPAAGWERPDYDDSGWSFVDSSGSCFELPGVRADCVWDYPYRYLAGDTLYIRKVFNIPEVPPRARIITAADDDVDIFLNGKLALHDLQGGTNFFETDVTNLLQPGLNVLVLRGTDTGEGAAFVQSNLGLCYDTQDQHTPLVLIMNHPEDWFDGKVSIEAVDAPCDSGIAAISYQVDGGEWQTVLPHQLFELPPGEHDVQARATDAAGKESFDAWHFRVGSPSRRE